MIIVRCPKCGATLEVYEDLAIFKCPKCNNMIHRKRKYDFK